jgi:hypothetical protein
VHEAGVLGRPGITWHDVDVRPLRTSLSWSPTEQERVAGAGGFDPRYGDSKSDTLACSRGAAEPHFIKIYKPLETFEFREPYRIRRVQSSGEKWVIRRRLGRLCRLEVRMRNRCCYGAKLLKSSGGEYRASAMLAERVGFEPMVRQIQ